MSLVCTVGEYLVYVIKYLVIMTVIGFMPVPLFTFLGGAPLAEQDHHPVFDYFSHYQIDTDSILERTYTNFYIDQKQKNIEEHELDNAIVFADFLTYQLISDEVPVVRSVISTEKSSKVKAIKSLHQQFKEIEMHNHELGETILDLKEKFEKILPIESITEDSRQWIILALGATEDAVKTQIKSLRKRFPDDQFVVISQLPMKIHKKAQLIQIPEFDVKHAKKVLSENLAISELQAELLLIHFDQSLWKLSEANAENSDFSVQTLLAESYEDFEHDLTKKQRKVLKELCEKGKAKSDKYDLRDWGVTKKGKFYKWADGLSELNYELAHEVSCGEPMIDIPTEGTNESPEEKHQGEQVADVEVDKVVVKDSEGQVEVTVNLNETFKEEL